jgi:hypothetical protein
MGYGGKAAFARRDHLGRPRDGACEAAPGDQLVSMAAARTRLIRRCCPLLLGAALAVPTLGAALESRAGAGAPAAGAARGDDRPAADSDGGVPDGGGTSADRAAKGGASGVAADDPRARARAAMRVLAHAVETVQRIGAKAPHDAYTADCIAERLAEARVGVRLGEQESARLEASLQGHDRGEADYALRRLDLLAARAASVLASARICAADDPGGVTATQVEVEISPAIPKGDPTGPPPPPPSRCGRPTTVAREPSP